MQHEDMKTKLERVSQELRDGDEHNIIAPEVLIPPTVVETLEQVIARDGAVVSATTMLRDEHDPRTLIAASLPRYEDALAHAAARILGDNAMAELAAQRHPGLQVNPVEIERGGPTYTIDTLSDLHNIFPTAELFFITGADALEKILTWREWEKAFDYATFVGVTRPGYLLRDTNLPEKYQDRVELVQIPAMAISSTDCRRRAHAGKPVWYLVPDGVVQYISKRGLYQ